MQQIRIVPQMFLLELVMQHLWVSLTVCTLDGEPMPYHLVDYQIIGVSASLFLSASLSGHCVISMSLSWSESGTCSLSFCLHLLPQQPSVAKSFCNGIKTCQWKCLIHQLVGGAGLVFRPLRRRSAVYKQKDRCSTHPKLFIKSRHLGKIWKRSWGREVWFDIELKRVPHSIPSMTSPSSPN